MQLQFTGQFEITKGIMDFHIGNFPTTNYYFLKVRGSNITINLLSLNETEQYQYIVLL